MRADESANVSHFQWLHWCGLIGAGVAVVGGLIGVSGVANVAGAGDPLAQILRHRWWQTSPSADDVEALVDAVAAAKPGSLVRFDDSGKSFQPVFNNPDAFSDPCRVLNSPSELSVCELGLHPDGRPLTQVRHCWIDISESQVMPRDRDAAVRLILQALDEAAADGR